MLSRFPRVRLASFPTPLEKAERLGRLLGVNVWVKRDDFMELAFGGNKVRKLEFLLGDALTKGADTVITTGSLHSNHARLTAAAATKLGLDTVLVLTGEKTTQLKGNLLLDALFGADVRIFKVPKQEVNKIMQEVAHELITRGKKPYIVPGGGANAIGCLGYVSASLEIVNQLNDLGVSANYLVHATGTGATQAGLTAGFKVLNIDVKVLGISNGRRKDDIVSDVVKLANETTDLLNSRVRIEPADVTVFDDYTCGGYGVITREVTETMKLAARSEGLVLDPVYTAKAMMGLISLAEKGFMEKGSEVIFLHTGGGPIIFQYDEKVQSFGL